MVQLRSPNYPWTGGCSHCFHQWLFSFNTHRLDLSRSVQIYQQGDLWISPSSNQPVQKANSIKLQWRALNDLSSAICFIHLFRLKSLYVNMVLTKLLKNFHKRSNLSIYDTCIFNRHELFLETVNTEKHSTFILHVHLTVHVN